MKRLMPFTLLFTTFALSIALPTLGFPVETAPLFEKTSLTRSFANQTYLYVFDFDFANHLSQPIEIISVSVFDMNGNKVEQDWEASGRNWDPRLMTHALSGDHPLVQIISKPRGTPLEQATVTPVGDRIEITVSNRILSAGEAIRPSLYLLSSKNEYDSLVLRVAYRVNGNLQAVSRPFAVGMREEERTASGGEPLNVPNPGAYKIAQAITDVWKRFNDFASSDGPTSLTDGIIAAGCLAGTAIVTVTKGYLPAGAAFEIGCVKGFQDIVTRHCGGGDPYVCFVKYMVDHPDETLYIVKDIAPGDIPP